MGVVDVLIDQIRNSPSTAKNLYRRADETYRYADNKIKDFQNKYIWSGLPAGAKKSGSVTRMSGTTSGGGSGGGSGGDIFGGIGAAINRAKEKAGIGPSVWQTLPDPAAGGGSGGGGGGYSAAAALQAMLSQIDESFNRQRGALDQNRAASMANLNSAMDRYRSQIGTNYADYQGQANATQQAIAQRIAEQQAAAQQRSTDLAQSIAGLGGNAAAIQAQSQGLQDALRASSGFQQDLSQRLAQVAANSQRQYESSGDLVRQGAAGTLENNYNSMLNALMAQMEAQKAEAQAAVSGGGGGGRSSGSSGGETDYTKMLKNEASKTVGEWILNEYTPTADDLAKVMLMRGGNEPEILTYLLSQQMAPQQPQE